jgi:hypothetical protein
MPLQKPKIPISDDATVKVSGLVVRLHCNYVRALVHLIHSLFQLWNGEEGDISAIGYAILEVPHFGFVIFGLSMV